MIIKELPENFIGRGEVKGFEFTQVTRTEHAYLYRVNTGHSEHYEVFERRLNRFGGISYPKSKAFGFIAYNAHSFNRALNMMQTITDRVKSRGLAI